MDEPVCLLMIRVRRVKFQILGQRSQVRLGVVFVGQKVNCETECTPGVTPELKVENAFCFFPVFLSPTNAFDEQLRLSETL